MAVRVTHPINCTYIHIPKTAGNSITSWLKQTATTKVTKRNQHATVQEVLEGNHSLGPMQMQDLGWKFCVVRNPWDYVVSWYTFEIRLCKQNIYRCETDTKWKHPTKEKYNLKFQQMRLKHLQDTGIKHFIENAHNHRYLHMMQSEWASSCDYVMKLENINEDFVKIQEKLNCYTPLPVRNKTKSRIQYQEYYTSELIDTVYKMYKKDINTYKYQF
jgi:chondroitin 4-sulfotransferase 11|tara:strand:+ start:731 stop:1378 length:648 start_codon:yes stop_codon:yes gene_type:complete